MAYATIESVFVRQYADTYTVLCEQKDSKLLSTITNEGEINGSSFTVNEMTGFGDLQAPTRFGDTQYNEVDFASRLATMSNYSNFTHIAPQDLPKLKAHPQDEMIQRLVSARNRKIDSIIYNGLIGTAQRKTTEADTFTAVALPAEQQIGTSAAPVTFSKQLLIDIRTKFMENEVPDDEEIIVTYNSDMLNMILADSTLTSADYLQGQMLQRGEINTFLRIQMGSL
ncbi:phage capsid protein [Acinetobacter baumannii]|nr:phage capsid protein [Acinetobacter baumannii]MDC4765117.1 phage capsid protein [Acinetobacter baumannii]MDC4860768.1 phage capsid protein [Acinetobacter baumannii]